MPRWILPLVLLAGCSQKTELWRPGVVFATARDANARGLLDRRGLIHAHSVYSHDACDGEPVKDGGRDPVCLDDFRRGLCQSQHDFVMLTDHRDAFDDTEFPEALLYRPERSDRLVERGGAPVASWAGCPDGSQALILAGAEAGTMPVGLEGHAAPREERGGLYGAQTPEAIERLRAAGAVVLMAHTEAWKPAELAALPLDGFEMYNLHANLFANAGAALELLLLNSEHPEELPAPDLILLPIITEDPKYLDTWAFILSQGHKRVTTMGTDCHRNTFDVALADGERVDSYRRMMIWFSNHLLVRPEADGSWDDRQLKDALRGGRLYGAMEVLGYPVGFDFFAEDGGSTFEMGETIGAAELVVRRPSIRGLDPERPAPAIRLRILRATAEGWQEVAAGSDEELRFTPSAPGAYRAEVRMIPRHLSADLGKFAPDVGSRELPWIYANPIYRQ